ncbi:MAG: pyridoxamine 5'-phosphate oxidase [Arcobacter sp.]|nr:MAG: pyridoxamine 5'-phosphate oxidase [Arcobacter sp.]
MAKFKEKLDEKLIKFINQQHMFFVATAPKEGKINISPKGLDGTLKIIDESTILWLNFFGSGNETAAHLQEDNRLTMMFCAFEGKHLILRLYCSVKVIQEKDKSWNKYIEKFEYTNGARQVFELSIESVNSSCGMGVPLYDFVSDRSELTDYYNNSTKEEHIAYMKKKNQISFDGKATNLF